MLSRTLNINADVGHEFDDHEIVGYEYDNVIYTGNDISVVVGLIELVE